MKKQGLPLILLLLVQFAPHFTKAQYSMDRQLKWEKNLIDIGAVMEENGAVTSEFFFVNQADFPIFIEEISTDCGCTTASYTTDTLSQDEIGSVKIKYTPTARSGSFSKMIVVKTNIDSDGDSLFLQGYNIPYPNNTETHYSNIIGGLGFHAPSVNMGHVFTNEPKIKHVDFFNFKDQPLIINLVRTTFPDYLQVRFLPMVVPAKTRGILQLSYDGAIKNDLGYFEENFEIILTANEEPPIPLKLMANVHEYFAPVRIGDVDKVPKLALSELEVDLNKINANIPVSKIITLTNVGAQPLNIRKVISNCECLVFSLEKNDLEVDEQVDLVFTFNPKGRRGIDHKTLTIFSNDPLNPTKTVVIKSRVQ